MELVRNPILKRLLLLISFFYQKTLVRSAHNPHTKRKSTGVSSETQGCWACSVPRPGLKTYVLGDV